MILPQASTDFGEGFLITAYSRIKSLFYKIKNKFNLITISLRSEQIIKVKSSIFNSKIIISHQKSHYWVSTESFNIAKDGEAINTIPNDTTKPVT